MKEYLNTKDRASPHFQAPRKKLKIRCLADYFWQASRHLKMWWIQLLSFQSKLKLRRKWGIQIVKILASWDQISTVITWWMSNEFERILGTGFTWKGQLKQLSRFLSWSVVSLFFFNSPIAVHYNSNQPRCNAFCFSLLSVWAMLEFQLFFIRCQKTTWKTRTHKLTSSNLILFQISPD